MLSWLIRDCQAKDSRLESADHAAMKMDARQSKVFHTFLCTGASRRTRGNCSEIR